MSCATQNIITYTMNKDIINTCPDVWKWDKTFPNYMFNRKIHKGVGTTILVKIDRPLWPLS